MNPSCTTHIMRRLAQNNKVLFVNPFSSDLSGGLKRGIGVRILRKIKSLYKVVRKPCENLYVFSPFFFPFQGKKRMDALNNTLLKIQFWLLLKFIGIRKPILWVENLRSADLLAGFEPGAVVFHVSDLFTQCKYTANRQVLETREKKILAASDLVICVSRPLQKRHSELHSNVHYIPHGVDFFKYHEAVLSGQTLPELSGIPHPIAGYFGTMTANNDIELLLHCARQLPHVSFVFAGLITGGNYDDLLSLPNVYHLGKLPYEKMPLLCAGFDVCLLQWKMSEWIRNCNPLKLLEYMASGKPIVSVPIRDVEERYSDLVSIADGKEAFCAAIKRELQSDTSRRSAARVEIARQHDWEQHVRQIETLISDTLSPKESSEPVGKSAHSEANKGE